MADNVNRVGAYLPTTTNFELAQIQSLNIDPAQKELLVRLYQYYNNTANVVNVKTSGYYILGEFVDGNLFFKNPSVSPDAANTPQFRNEFRTTINFGALPNAGAKVVPHGITVTSSTIWTNVTGTATSTTALTGIPIPFASTIANGNISISVDNTNVSIITALNYSVYDQCIVVLEYLQN